MIHMIGNKTVRQALLLHDIRTSSDGDSNHDLEQSKRNSEKHQG